MTVLVVIVTRDTNIHELVRSKSSGLLSPDLRRFGSEAVELASYHIDQYAQVESAKRYVVRSAKGKSGVIVLSEAELANSFVALADGYLLSRLTLTGEPRGPLRPLNKTVAKALKALDAIRSHNRSSKYGRIIRLPLVNFDAAEMAELQALCADPLTADFRAELLNLLEKIRRARQMPLMSKRFPKPNYVLVDDRGHCFSFGSEQHSEPDTGEPHTYGCHLRKEFRFGDAIEPWRHYNVTAPNAAIDQHDFTGCHGATTRCSRNTHANVFPGGFVG